MHVGSRIKQVMEDQGRSVIWLAKQIACERTNVYNIFSRKDINTNLLRQISVVLGHDFFKELSDEISKKRR